ncbi:MBL fold metallo-hydrolase [Georgenia sp. TF02-10]|uniref:MBL fold metallo-hydrolase n=1 Tax=Georgenia sp. TF02-10 TaxID=2917725 RepID=UPI001FA711F4|nr:MBL fold metallo-hydrolase [Georgenia sp. TF02-10]UNX56275.1 MBL fold metallo-hydrolase [Georgenia sp. TF02-10]
MSGPVQELAPGVFRVRDTCNVYVVRAAGERTGVAIDFGSGLVLDHLAEMGIDALTDVLMTHHHRDQGQGLPRAVAAGINVHVPPTERDLFDRVDEMWSARPVYLDYNLREDRFSLLEPVPVAGVVPEYRTGTWGGVRLAVRPTPGHTTGSVTYLLDRDGARLAFSGDLIYAPGKVCSLAATQWSYTENEGPAMTVLSCYQLRRERPDLLLPSHGEPMTDPAAALDLLAARMQRYVDSRRPHPWDLRARLDEPFVRLTEHLLLNRSSTAYGYVLLSRTGEALLVDYGYDMTTGLPAGADRAARRPWLASLPALRRGYGVSHVAVAMPTHYHDDHVAGLNLLRDVEGTQVWVPANVAPVLRDPLHQDLPCQWFEPVPADRELALGETVRWHEYEITVHELPGHTRYAAAYELEVDGVRVLLTGDQQDGRGVPGHRREILNYQYRNRLDLADYRASAALYRRVRPALMLGSHWEPRWVDDAYLDMLAREGEELVDLHRELLPLAEHDLAADGVLARVSPYLSTAAVGTPVDLTVTVRSPSTRPAEMSVRPVLPPGWTAEPPEVHRPIEPGTERAVTFRVTTGGRPARRARFAADVCVGDLRLGQAAEALVDVVTPAGERGAAGEGAVPAEAYSLSADVYG